MIAYFILLGDFLPSILSFAYLQARSAPLTCPPGVLRTRCMVSTLVIIVPLSIPKTLSALRYANPIALLAIVLTSATVIVHCPSLFSEHHGEPKFGEVEWGAIGSWGGFEAFSIFLFAYNGHLNVVSVATEFQRPSDPRITKVGLWVTSFLLFFYAAIAVGGYLSFVELTAQNILQNYPSSPIIAACQLLFSCSLTVGIATYLNPTVRALQSVAKTLIRTDGAAVQPLLQDAAQGSCDTLQLPKGSAARDSELLRFLLIAGVLSVTLTTGIFVPDVAGAMGFIGASVGTWLMMVLPTIVLFKATPPEFSRWRVLATAAVLLGAAAMACVSICVMFLQKLGA